MKRQVVALAAAQPKGKAAGTTLVAGGSSTQGNGIIQGRRHPQAEASRPQVHAEWRDCNVKWGVHTPSELGAAEEADGIYNPTSHSFSSQW